MLVRQHRPPHGCPHSRVVIMRKIGDVTRKRRLGDPVRVRFYGYWRSLRWRSRMTGRPLPSGALDGFRASLNSAR
jgi:hypothetical protein